MKAEKDELRQAIDGAIQRIDELIERKRHSKPDTEPQAQAQAADGTDSLVDEPDREEVRQTRHSHL